LEEVSGPLALTSADPLVDRHKIPVTETIRKQQTFFWRDFETMIPPQFFKEQESPFSAARWISIRGDESILLAIPEL
jgi:hypothetical protein